MLLNDTEKINIDETKIDEIIRLLETIESQLNLKISMNIAKSGITKGNHWHHSKNGKFLVVSGKGLIRFRKIDTEETYFLEV